MADGDKDILQLHFGIDIRDVDSKVNQIKEKLGSIVTSYQENIGKLKDLFSEVFEPPKGANETDKATSAFDKYMAKLDRIKEKADSFSSMNSRIRKELRQTILSGTNDLQNVESALTRIANLFDKGMNITNFRGLTETQGAFSQFAHALAQFKSATLNKNSLGLDEISKEFEESVSKITKNWKDLEIVLAKGPAGQAFANLTERSFSNVLKRFQEFKNADPSVVGKFFEGLMAQSGSLQKVSALFLDDTLYGGEKFTRALETQLQKSVSQGLDTAYGAIATNLANLGKAVQEFPSGTEAKLQEFGRGLASVTGLLSNSEIGMNASSIVDLLNSAGSAVQIDGEQLAKNIEQKIQSVKVSINLKLNTNSITQADRDEANAALSKHPLSIPVEFVFETGAKRVESAAKAASQAAEKSMSFSAELEELKAYREYLNATAIDAATFREKLDSVYENLFPRRNKPSLADNELLPQADKLIAEMEDKAAKLADASAKATARQQLMIGGDAIEAFRVDAQAKLDAMKPLEFTNIKLKASTVDASGIKEAVGLDKLESNAKLLKNIAVPLSKLDVSNARPVNADILQKNFDALVNLTIPISRLTFSDDVSKMDTTKLKDNVDTLGNKLVLPIYKADLENVRAIQSGEDVSKKISDLAHLVAYIQSVDMSKATITNEETLRKTAQDFISNLKLPGIRTEFSMPDSDAAAKDIASILGDVRVRTGSDRLVPLYFSYDALRGAENEISGIINGLRGRLPSVPVEFSMPDSIKESGRLSGIIQLVKNMTQRARDFMLHFDFSDMEQSGPRIDGILKGLQNMLKPLNVSIEVAAGASSHTVIQNMVAEVNNIVTAIDTVPAAFAEMGKALNGEGIASPSNMKQIQDAFDKLAKAIGTVSSNFKTMSETISSKVVVPMLEQKDIDRMFSYAKAIRTITSSMKYLQGLQKMLANLGVTSKDVASQLQANLANAMEPTPEVIAKRDEFIHGSATRAAESLATNNADVQKKVADVLHDNMNYLAQQQNVDTLLPFGAYKGDTAYLRDITTSLGAFNSAVKEQLGLQDSLADVMQKDARFTSAFGQRITDTKGRLDDYTATLRRVLDMADNAPGSMSIEFDRASRAYDRLYRSMNASKMGFDAMVNAIKAGRFDIRGGGMNIAGLDVTALKRLQAEMRTTGDSFTEMMRTMGFYITGRSVITFFQNAIKSASQFSMEIRRIQSLATTFDFDRIKTGLESLDARFGNLIHNAKALYWAFSSGVRGTEEELVRFTETMSKTAITIGSDVMPVMDAATTLMNAYGKSAASAGEISDLLFTIVKEGKANGQQLASSIGNIIAPASAMGLTFKDIGATISTLTRTMKTNNALTYLNNILAKMNNPTKEVQSQLDKLGLEINATAIKAKGFAQVMREIHEATRGDINLIAKIFPDIRGQRAAVTLFSTQFGEFQRQLENFGNMEGNMQEALSKITDNPEAQFAALRNGFEMIRQAAGDAAINVVTLGGALTPIFSAVNGMKSFGRSVAGHIAGLAALGVVMNMLGKARLMLESSNISAIQQMNLAYNEQTKAKGDSVLSMREQEVLNQSNRTAVLERWRNEKLANDEEYKSLQLAEGALKARQNLLKARMEEAKAAVTMLQSDRDALNTSEQMYVLSKKNLLAYERFKGALSARESVPRQWDFNDRLTEAGAIIRNFKNETKFLGFQRGIKTGDLEAIVNQAIADAIAKGQQGIDAAAVARAAGIAANDTYRRDVLARVIAEANMERVFNEANEQFKQWVKGGDKTATPAFVGSLTTKMNALNADLQNRANVAYTSISELDKLYSQFGFSEAQRKLMTGMLAEMNVILSDQSRIESDKYRMELEVGGPAYKMQIDASKALAQSMASEYKLHEKNMQDIISETEARVKNAAAQRDAAKAEAEAMRGRQRLNDYIVQNNLQFGKQKTKLDELIQSYRQLAVASNAAFQWKQTPVALAEQIARQRYLQTGQFNNESGAWRGAWAAAGAAAQNAQISSFLNKLSFLPGVGGMVGMFVRPFSMFYKEFVKLGGVVLQGSSAVMKFIAVKRAENAIIGRNIALGRTLTVQQALANASISKFIGTIMALRVGTPRTIGQMAALGHAARSLGISVRELPKAMMMVGMAGGIAIGALAGLGALLISMTNDGGPFRRLAEWMEGLGKIRQRGTALDSISGMARDVAIRRNDFEQRRQYLLAELDYRRQTGQVIGETNGVDAMIIRQSEQQLRNVKLERSIERERLSQLSSQYAETYAGAESLFNKYDVTYQNGFWRQLWEVSTAIDWRKITFPTETYRIVSDMVRLQKASWELRGLDIDIDTERFTSQQIVPRAIATLRSHEMLLEMENNTADVMAQEQNNAMRQLALETKRNLTLRRMSILTGGKSPYMKMYEVATAEEVARAKKEEADFRLQKMLENGMSAESDAYKTQSALAERLGKELERAETAAGNFHTSYVNYRKQQAQQLLEQIKLDREIAEMNRKGAYQELDRQALLGGNYADAAKLEMQMKDAYKMQQEAAERNTAMTLDAYKKQFMAISRQLPSMGEDVARKESQRDKAKNALLALGLDVPDEERKKALQAYEKAKAEATGARNALNSANAELRNLKTLAEQAKRMPLTEKELYEIRQKQIEAAKNLANFWGKVLQDMTAIIKQSKQAVDDIQINRIKGIISGERRVSPFTRQMRDAMRERLFMAQTEDEAREIRRQYRREAILRNPSQGLGATFAKAGVLKGYVNEAIIRDQREFMQLRKWLEERGGMMGPDERSRTLARMRELQDSITKGMESYIGVQGDLVKRQKEARNGILQLAQSLQKFRSVAADAVDSLSSEAFSMRFRSFSGLKELPQMRTTTAEERSMYGNMERKDAWGTMANEVMAAFAERYGEEAKKRYETAIKGLDAPANTFKTAAETFDRAVQRPLTVNVNAVDVFGGRQ